MPRVILRDKIGGTQALPAQAGQTLLDLLRVEGVPVNAVITRVNGKLAAEDSTVIGADDFIEVIQVRHYDMGVTRSPSRRRYPAAEPVYTKSIAFDNHGDVEVRSEQLDAAGLPRYVEDVFVDSVLSAGTIREGEHVMLGLSGGRDSIALLKLLERTRDRLPAFRMTALTVTGLPDWEETATFRAAVDACRQLGLEHEVATAHEVQEVFSLSMPFVDAMNTIVASDRSSATMLIGHQVLRRMLEVHAARRGIDTIAWGFNADDLLASLVTWWMSGYRMGQVPVREIGDFRYTFPLYRVTKKELTLYLELVAPEWNQQGAPGRFTTGPDERSMSYAIADHLLDLWPGADHYAFKAFDEMHKYFTQQQLQLCSNCGGELVLQVGAASPPGLCDVCDVFSRMELIRPRAEQ